MLLQEGVADSDSALQELSTALPEYHVACVNYSTAKKGYSGALVMLHKDCPKPIHMTAEDLPSAKNEGRMVVVEFEALYVILHLGQYDTGRPILHLGCMKPWNEIICR